MKHRYPAPMPPASLDELKEYLAMNIRDLRKQLKMTQEEAAEATGLNWRHWQKMEAGEVNVTLSTLSKICQGLGVEVGSLFESSKRKHRS